MSYNVLIADDTLLNRKVIRDSLSKKIFDIRFFEAEDGKEALEYIYDNRIDLLILDLLMPNMDGFCVLEELKSSKKYNDLPILVNSSHNNIEVIRKALELGATDYFTKPLTMQQVEVLLPLKVRNAIRAYEQKRQLIRMNDRMREELKFATALQSLLIDHNKTLSGLQMWGKYIPSAEVSGDFYECIERGDRTWIFIADVSGHGVAAAMVSSMIKVMLKNLISRHDDPASLMREMNTNFYNLTHGAYYTTAFLGLLEGDTLTYVSGGHPYPIVYRQEEDKLFLLEKNGFIVGIQEEYAYESDSMELLPGDFLIMYTDGIFEAEDFDKGPRTCDDLLLYVDDNKELLEEDPDKLLEGILKDFGKGDEIDFVDDVALVIIKRI